MTSQPSRPPDPHAQVLTADRLRSLIADSLTDQPEVIACRPILTIYADRLALSVKDRTGQALARPRTHGGPTVSGDEHDQVGAIDLDALTDDQREGLTCINCGRFGGPMRPILTPDNPQSTMVFFHADTGLCVRYIARYITGLHMRMVSIAEDAVQVLVQADSPHHS